VESVTIILSTTLEIKFAIVGGGLRILKQWQTLLQGAWTSYPVAVAARPRAREATRATAFKQPRRSVEGPVSKGTFFAG
jgi:hypothetical protein